MTRTTDQASTLRAWAQREGQVTAPPIGLEATLAPLVGGPPMIAVGGGKGGIGKTMLTANLAVAMGARGRRVLAVDADLGLSNLDLALGAIPEHTMMDMLDEATVNQDLLAPAGHNVRLLAGSLGRLDLMRLGPHGHMRLMDKITRLQTDFDVVLLDMASGIGEHVMHFAGCAKRVIVVATPEPTSLADAYAFIKVLRARCGIKQAYFVANMVRSQADGEALYGRVAQLADRFLGVDLGFLGALSHDGIVPDSIRRRRPFVRENPQAAVSYGIEAIAARLLRMDAHEAAIAASTLHSEIAAGRAFTRAVMERT
jgi:flagellar biosynthesis protein FlhG